MLSEGTQIIVNLVSGALLSFFLCLNMFVLVTSEGEGKEGTTLKKLLAQGAAYFSIHIFAGILALTAYLSPVEIRWWHLLGSFFGCGILVGGPFLIHLDRRIRSERQRRSTSLDRENGSDA